jgi:hypothetical protein
MICIINCILKINQNHCKLLKINNQLTLDYYKVKTKQYFVTIYYKLACLNFFFVCYQLLGNFLVAIGSCCYYEGKK